MDFVIELLESHRYNAVYVIINKLTKYGLFLPFYTAADEVVMAEFFYKNVYHQFGLPLQIISDHDSQVTGYLWVGLCHHLGTKRSLTTSYHPQADEQTKVLNQTMEIALRAFVSSNKDNWSQLLPAFVLSYNMTPHSSHGFSPALLLLRFKPQVPSSLLAGNAEYVVWLSTDSEKTDEFLEGMLAIRSQAADVLAISQSYYKHVWNEWHKPLEFEIGDLALINPHSLGLMKGKGLKLTPRLEGPFEVLARVSEVAYRLRLPASYKIHPVVNIQHLESFVPSPEEFGPQPKIQISHQDFEDLPEDEVEQIIGEGFIKTHQRHTKYFKIRWAGYGPDHDTWQSQSDVRNTPDTIKAWERLKAPDFRPTELTRSKL